MLGYFIGLDASKRVSNATQRTHECQDALALIFTLLDLLPGARNLLTSTYVKSADMDGIIPIRVPPFHI